MDDLKNTAEHRASSETERKMKLMNAEGIGFVILTSLAFLIPLFFIPVLSLPLAKSILLYAAILSVLSVWITLKLKQGTISFTRNGVIASLLLLVVAMLASSLIAPGRAVISSSLVGSGVETGTASFIGLMVVLVLLVSHFFSSRTRILNAYLAIFVSFSLVFLYILLKLLFGPEALSLGYFGSTTANPVGSWNDLAILAGAVALVSFITLEILKLEGAMKWIIYGAFGSSLILLALVNFTPIWYVLGVISVLFLAYNVSVQTLAGANTQSETGKSEQINPLQGISHLSIFLIILSFVFIVAHRPISELVSSTFNISVIEARPSWTTTYDLAKTTLAEDPILGVGPNRFAIQWLEHKPAQVNLTDFWNTEFIYGVGYLPSFVVTTGIVGTLAWILFLVSLIYVGYKSIFAKIANRFARYCLLSSFLAALYFWALSIFYVPSLTIIFLAFFFTGLFMAALANEKVLEEREVRFVTSPRLVAAAVLLSVVMFILTVGWGYVMITRFVGALYANQANAAWVIEGDIDRGEDLIIRAISYNPQDSYYRFLVSLQRIRVNILLNQENVSPDALRAQFQTQLDATVNNALVAVQRDPANYLNWLTAGQLFASYVPLQVEGAYEQAVEMYTQAKERNPRSPQIPLLFAELEASRENYDAAKEYIAEALGLKNNYIDAVFLLSQVQVAEGNIDEAIASVETATVAAPFNSALFFQLGLLRYNDDNFVGAAQAFERALTLQPSYANARYFLGLSYYEQNRNDDAITQFEILQNNYPNNQEVNLILTNLRNNQPPFTGAQPPIDDAPESRSTPPVNEPDTDENAETEVE